MYLQLGSQTMFTPNIIHVATHETTFPWSIYSTVASKKGCFFFVVAPIALRLEAQETTFLLKISIFSLYT